MSTSHVAVFDSTLNITHEWLRDLTHEGNLRDQSQAYSILRAVLHALRDRLIPDEAVNLGAQLPMLVRGFYYEGWKPSATPVKDRSKQGFLESIEQTLRSIDAEPAARAVFRLLERYITPGEIDDIRKMLPKEIRDLWPSPTAKAS